MRTIATALFIVSLVCTPILGGVVLGEVKNLSVDQKITAKIEAFDTNFFKGFDVYSAGTREAPTALLFDQKDKKYHLPAPSWGQPLSGEEEVIFAIKRLHQQYQDRSYKIPMPTRALNIVNTKGEVLGYVYTGVETVLMDRKKDGQVMVYRPGIDKQVGGGGGR